MRNIGSNLSKALRPGMFRIFWPYNQIGIVFSDFRICAYLQQIICKMCMLASLVRILYFPSDNG